MTVPHTKHMWIMLEQPTFSRDESLKAAVGNFGVNINFVFYLEKNVIIPTDSYY